MRNNKEQGRLGHTKRSTSKMLKRGDLVILVAKTEEETWTKCKDWLDQCTSTTEWEWEAATTKGQEPIPKPPSDSPTSGTPIDDDEREIPKERTAFRTTKRSGHGKGEAMKDNKTMQTGGAYLESAGTKEKYTTQVTARTFAWKDVWWEV